MLYLLAAMRRLLAQARNAPFRSRLLTCPPTVFLRGIGQIASLPKENFWLWEVRRTSGRGHLLFFSTRSL